MRKLSPVSGVLLLVSGVVVSVAILLLTRYTTNFILQTILLLSSMGLIFFSSHPLSHYVVARLYGVDVKYFFLGKSDFRKLGGTLGKFGDFLPTIGTKVDLDQTRKLSKKRRGFLFGSGAIVSSVLMLFPLVVGLIFGLNYVALILGTLLFIGSLGTELVFSTKAGEKDQPH
ncbi:MAG: hypothetical protein M1368_04015 [Thaumarchaeota archaeon]|nr:hypothetical protein [Nitrososphaerota archaeon]